MDRAETLLVGPLRLVSVSQQQIRLRLTSGWGDISIGATGSDEFLWNRGHVLQTISRVRQEPDSKHFSMGFRAIRSQCVEGPSRWSNLRIRMQTTRGHRNRRVPLGAGI